MKLSKKTFPNYFPDDDFSSQAIADQELKELAEKLERELGHHYFSKPLDYSGHNKETKNAELLELEQEIANLGEIVLPQANLNPSQELPAPKKIINKKPIYPYKNFKLYLPKKKKTPKNVKTKDDKYQSFELYKKPQKNIAKKNKNFTFKLTNDKNLQNWKKPLQQNYKLQKNRTVLKNKKKVSKESFWGSFKKKRQAQKIIRRQLKEKKLLEKKQRQEEKTKLIIAQRELRTKQKLAKAQQQETARLAELEVKKQQELVAQQAKEKQKLLQEQLVAKKAAAKSEALKQKELLKEQAKKNQEEKYAIWLAQKQVQKLEKEKARKESLEKKNLEKEKNNLPFAWYLNLIKKPVLYLVTMELLIYFLSAIPLIKAFILNTLLDYLLIIDVFVFIWLTFTLKRHLSATSLVAIKAVMMTGLLVGFFRALFKIFWFSENWTLINILVEPLIWGFYALITATIFSLIIKKNDNRIVVIPSD